MPASIPPVDDLTQLRDDAGVTLYRGAIDDDGAAYLMAVASESASGDARWRLETEFEHRHLLVGDWSARPTMLVTDGHRLKLLLSDPGGVMLRGRIGLPWDISKFLNAAIGISMSVGQMHHTGLMHCDLNPGNIFLDLDSGRAWLTGLAIASRVTPEPESFSHPKRLAGSLAYMAPEQTGHMNRPVDCRSDLYALGMIFYEMLAGSLPFSAADTLEWIHCHVARLPEPLSARKPSVPKQLSTLVMRLLAKTGEGRYQSAAGLEADLRRCLDEWAATGQLSEFPLGGRDNSQRLVVPEKLYGRAKEVASLLTAFERVRASGRPELTLIAGYSGIGKSSLVNELHKRADLLGATFVAGKFDLLQADAPYSTLAEASRFQLRHILAAGIEQVAQWRGRIAAAVGAGGETLIEVMPELALLLGPQKPLPVLSPAEALVRFRTTLTEFVRAFARSGHPLVLFMDDLQWQDSASLAFMEHLASHPALPDLHLVGAYRDNELGNDHPLLNTISAIEASGMPIERITLEALAFSDVNQLVADALRMDTSRCQPLAEVVFRNTGGNPFFASQVLADTAEQDLLQFEPETRRWTWDLRSIDASGYTANLTELMIRRIWRLPDATQEALKVLSCFGSTAPSLDLALVYGQQMSYDQHFLVAVEAGVVLVRDGQYHFAHDRVQEAAYAVIPHDARASLHLRIGTALANGLPPDQVIDRIFDIANQFNSAKLAVSSVRDRVLTAELNLKAGLKAKASTAYAAACSYFSSGIEALGEDAWANEYELAFNLRFELAECEISRTRVDAASVLIEMLIQRAGSKVDSARAYVLRMTLQLMRGEAENIVPTALEGLALLGHSFPPRPSSEELFSEYQSMRQALGDRPISSLVDLPLIRDRETAAATTIMFHVGLAAYFTDANLFQIIACRLVSLTLVHGISEASTFGLSCVGLSLGPVLHRFADGESFARASVAITKKSQFRAINAGAYVTLQQALIWTSPVRDAIACLDIAFQIAKDAGSLIFACYSVEHKLTDLLFRGDSLSDLRREIAEGLAFAERNHVKHVGDIIASMQGFVSALMGTLDDLSLTDDHAIEERAQSSGIPIVNCFHWILQLQRYVLLGDPHRALSYAHILAPLEWSARFHVQWANLRFYESLAIAATLNFDERVTPSAERARLATNLDSLKRWAASCPSSFDHRLTLASAELARLEGRSMEASQLYERAIHLASESGFRHECALAWERAAAHCRASGLKSAAAAYLKQARDEYLTWGAHAKVALLENQHPELGRSSTRAPLSLIEGALDRVDVLAIVRASQALSEEIVLAHLVQKLMTIAIEHAGAQGGSLLLRGMGGWRLEAVASSSASGVSVEPIGRLLQQADLPSGVLDAVLGERRTIVIGDASEAVEFAEDPYVLRERPRSIVCLPLITQGRLVGVLYLENNLATNVFTLTRSAVLELLSSQAAISLQNADLYGRLARENAERKQSEAALQESQVRYALAIAAAADGHADWVAESDILYASPRFLEQWGLPAEMSTSRSKQMLDAFPFHPEDRPRVVELIESSQVSDAERLEFDTRVIREGETRWMHVTALYTRDDQGRIVRASIATTDITERMRSAEELRTSEERYALALAGANEGIFDLDLITESLYLPARTQELIGVVPTGEVRRTIKEWMGVVKMHPEDEELHRDALAKHLAGLTPAYDVELRYMAGDSVRWVRQRGQALRDDLGKVYRLVGSVGDISERKQQEEDMRRLEVRLRQAERFEAMGTLADGIAHDLNNILGAILGFGERAMRSAVLAPGPHRHRHQNIGGLIGSALLGSYQTIQTHAHLQDLAARTNVGDAQVQARIVASTRALGPTIADPILRSQQAGTALAVSMNREASILAFNDVFGLIWKLSLATGALVIILRLFPSRRLPRTAVA